MGTRSEHRASLFSDRDVVQTLAVAGAACVLSAGLVYVGYFVHVLRVARKASCEAAAGDCVLVFGKHAPAGAVDLDFDARVERAALLWHQAPGRHVMLLGGGPDDMPSEAELARRGLLARGIAADAPLLMETRSRDTLQNLRNARDLLQAGAHGVRVTLLSSRYHLARCALLARQLGMEASVCAAETRLAWRPSTLARIAGEAAYVCWSDLGTRWARLIGHRRMLLRLT